MPVIASDGSSLGTQTEEGRKAEGPGAFGVVVRFEDDHPNAASFTQTMVGGRRKTTTGEIELLGFLCALETVRAHKEAMEADPTSSMMAPGDHFTIVLDSEYVAKGFKEHLDGWVENEWRTSGFRRISHQIHWQDVHDLRNEVGHLVTVVHQRGHTRKSSDEEVDLNVELNDEADKAAGIASRAIRDTGHVPTPHPVVWRRQADAADTREADVRKLQALTEMVLVRHGRGPAVEAFRQATHATGIRE